MVLLKLEFAGCVWFGACVAERIDVVIDTSSSDDSHLVIQKPFGVASAVGKNEPRIIEMQRQSYI